MHPLCTLLSIFCTKCYQTYKLLTCIINLALHSSLQRHGRTWLPTSKLAPLCLESSVRFEQRSTSLPRHWPSSFSSSFQTSPWCQGSSCSIRSNSGSTAAEQWGRPAGEVWGAPPGRWCCTLPGCVCPSPGARVGWKNPEFCLCSHPWLSGLFNSQSGSCKTYLIL